MGPFSLSRTTKILSSILAFALVGMVFYSHKDSESSLGEGEIPTPYSLLFHPYLSWKEKMISPVIDYLINSKGLGDDAVAELQKGFQAMDTPGAVRPALQRWEAIAGCKLAESKGKIPFQRNILKDWGIVDNQTILPEAATTTERESVDVLVRFPSSLLPAEGLEKLADTGSYEVDFDTIDWKTFAPGVPVIVQFHGGGYIIGISNDPMVLEEAVRLIETASADSSKEVITISVDYALAPKEPFPLGVMDALSVLDFLCRQNSRGSIHVTGQSAGAGLSLVAGMEGFRKFPSQIASIQSQSPFVDPASDTISYWMNQKPYPDNSWLRFCWQAYLGLEKPPPDDVACDETCEAATELERVLRKGSNHASWKKWKENYPSPNLHRLVNPIMELPEGLESDQAPTIVIRYNRGDPLYSEGEAVAQALRPRTGSNAGFYESNGLHADVMAAYDPKSPQEYYTFLAEAVFGKKSS